MPGIRIDQMLPPYYTCAIPDTDDIHGARAEDARWADLLAFSALQELNDRFPEGAKRAVDALLREHPEAALPLPAIPAPDYSPWGQDCLRAGDPPGLRHGMVRELAP